MKPTPEQVKWFAWMLVNGRNHWWHPDDTAEQCVVDADGEPIYDDKDEQREALVREQGHHWGKFLAHDELIYDFGRMLWPDSDMKAYESYGDYRRTIINRVERLADDYIHEVNAENARRGEDGRLDEELSRAEITEQMRLRHED